MATQPDGGNLPLQGTQVLSELANFPPRGGSIFSGNLPVDGPPIG
ncbi:MAG: hypothetical protein VW985_06980 [Gammaproteobacteria bacterium]